MRPHAHGDAGDGGRISRRWPGGCSRRRSAAGAEAADAIAVAGDSLSIEVRNGALEQAERAEGDRPRPARADRPAAGLRLVERHPRRDHRRDGRARGRDGARGAGGPLVRARRARASWRAAGTPPRSTSRTPRRCPPPDALQAAALAAEAAALAVPGRQQDGRRRRRLVGARGCTSPPSNGFSGGYARTGHSLQAVAICGEGTAMERDYAFEGRSPPRRPARPGRGRPARRRAHGGAGRRRQAADRRLSGPLRRAGRLRADRPPGAGDQRRRRRPRRELAQGRAWAKRVLPARHRPRRGPAPPAHRRLAAVRRRGAAGRAPRAGRGRRPEGLDARPRHRAPARAARAPATPARGTSAPPSPSAGNLALTPGPRRPRRRSSPRWAPGLLVTSLIGASINPTTGDYSRGASGFWVENGRDRAAGERMHHRRQPPRHAARRSARPTTRCRIARAAGAEPPRRRAGHCRKLTSRSSRRRRGRRARSRSRRVGRPGEVREKPGGSGRSARSTSRSTGCCAPAPPRGAARLRLALGGERGRPRAPARLAARRVFIVDPIDGTRAFLAGEPAWALSLAVVEAGRPVAGVVHLPALGRTYAAAAGQAARG